MSEQLTYKHELLLLNLLLTGDTPMVSKVKPKMTKAACQPLVEKGLIKLEKKGAASHLVLEDKAWYWMTERFQSEDFKIEINPRFTTAIPIFQVLLMRLGQYMRTNDVPLVDFLAPSASSSDTPTEGQTSNASLKEKIREAYASITQNSPDFRAKLSQIHQYLGNFSPETINNTLCSMQQTGEVSLSPMEDPQEIGPEDEQAAIDLGGGDKRYFAYIK
ncbi:hypothetical protein Lepto7375DRAFT_8135 [Leptolyngbya sp. PCC 7375]|nr:hypothetical protein Lepto7375DRAFT_8135 [Leptolyngbya sp. PCC 7375]